MKKDFITVTPDSGSSNETVNVTADPNTLYKERETSLNFSASGISKAVNIIQQPMPYYFSIGVKNKEFDFGSPRLVTMITPTALQVDSNGKVIQNIDFFNKVVVSSSSSSDIYIIECMLLILSEIDVSRIKLKYDDGSSYIDLKLKQVETSNNYTTYSIDTSTEITIVENDDILKIKLLIDDIEVLEITN